MMTYNQKLHIQKNKLKILDSSAYTFKPIYAIHFGSPAEAMVYNQLLYRATTSKHKYDEENSVRFSYTRLAKMFGYSRKWMIETIKKLAIKGAIEVITTGRVNRIVFKKIELSIQETPRNKAKMLVFPELLNKVGLLESIALQQIHIRHFNKNEKFWVVRSYAEWREEVFMYLSISTVKRLFKKLESKKLVDMQKYENELGVTNSYRVNYQGLADLLDIYLGKSGW